LSEFQEAVMNLIARGLFVVGGIAVGSFALNHFVFGNTGDALITSSRIGEWRKAEVRESCFPATERPESDGLAPRMPAGPHRISSSDYRRAVEMTVALNCYVVTKQNAKKKEMLATAKNYGEAEIRKVQALWDSHRNRAIEQALAAHVKSGRLNRGDFGFFMPDGVQPILAQHSGTADTCPPTGKA
jgi:hypothetical protein